MIHPPPVIMSIKSKGITEKLWKSIIEFSKVVNYNKNIEILHSTIVGKRTHS